MTEIEDIRSQAFDASTDRKYSDTVRNLYDLIWRLAVEVQEIQEKDKK